jgi:hypothetical protein
VKNISLPLSALRRFSRRRTEHLEQRKMSLWIWRRRSAKQYRSGLADLFGKMNQDAVINRIVPYLGEKQNSHWWSSFQTGRTLTGRKVFRVKSLTGPVELDSVLVNAPFQTTVANLARTPSHNHYSGVFCDLRAAPIAQLCFRRHSASCKRDGRTDSASR